MEPYHYHSLQNGQIRLLDIIASDGQLEVSLRAVDLGAKPSYITMSYCWEGQQPEITLKCGKHTLKVTRNVSKMIEYMAKHYPRRSIWVDAVCIDQESTDEKNLQVPLMSRIYSISTMTVAWLGNADSDISAMASELPDMLLTAKKKASINPFAIAEWEALGIQKGVPGPWLGLYKLFLRPWFRRLWVRQEYVLSKDLVMVCGESQFHSRQLEDLVADNYGFVILSIRQIGQDINANFVPAAMSFNRSRQYSNNRKRQGGGEWEGIPLPNLLVGAQDLLAFDPRDLIYGLHGMTTTTWRELLPVDYKLSAADLFTNLASHWLTMYPGLQVLSLASSTKRTTELASWVPNIGNWTQANAMGIYSQEQFSAGTASVYKPILNRFPNPIPEASCSKGLELIGFQIDTLSEVISAGWAKTRNSNAATESLAWIDQCLQLVSDNNLSKAAFARTLIGNDVQLHLQDQTALNISEVFSEAYAAFKGLTQPRDIKPIVRKYLQILSQFCIARSFFITEMGRMGLGAADVRKGDVVVIFCGAALPFVLRQVPGGYELVGETYVDGVMYGEALERPQANMMRKFTLL